jgi:mannose-6-phosphate isomerase-like protein (cupin superfamily)
MRLSQWGKNGADKPLPTFFRSVESMRFSKKMAHAMTIAAALTLPAMITSVGAQERKVWTYWAPKPAKLPPYVAPMKPVTHYADVVAKHKGEARWSEDVIKTTRFHGEWVQMAAGDKTPTMLFGDDRTFWVVWDGQVRFSIDGQKPFVATKGFLVQVPFRVPFKMETVGDAPARFYRVTHTGRLPLYAADEPQPAALKDGTQYIKVTTPSTSDTYKLPNRPYRDFLKDVVAADPTHGPADHSVASDDDLYINIIRGQGFPTPPPTNKGHFHVGNDEFWFILEGKVEYLIQDVGLVTSEAGDVVFVPPGRWHRATWANGQMDTRLSFNNRPDMLHDFAEDANGHQ